MNKNLDYLDLEIGFENYQLCRRITSDKNKINCSFKDSFNHRLHSSSNTENFEQLNVIVDLLCNLSKNNKINLKKLGKISEPTSSNFNINKNLRFIKQLLEDNFSKTKTINLEELNNKIINLDNKINKIERNLEEVNKQLYTILYE